MKYLIKVMTISVVLGILLVACSGRVEQDSTNVVDEEPSNPGTPPLAEVDPGLEVETLEEVEEDLSFPTPSPLFVQNYGPNATSDRDYSELEIVTLLPFDAIPAIDNPQFYSAEEANEEYAPDELVIGVEYNGDARAYSVSLLSGHEIVNDTVGGVKIAVTW